MYRMAAFNLTIQVISEVCNDAADILHSRRKNGNRGNRLVLALALLEQMLQVPGLTFLSSDDRVINSPDPIEKFHLDFRLFFP
jgi:hypothetical protein